MIRTLNPRGHFDARPPRSLRAHALCTLAMENTGFDYVVKPLEEFTKGSIRLVKRCTKPDKKGEQSHPMRVPLDSQPLPVSRHLRNTTT